MTYRNHCNTLSTFNYTGGASQPIADLIAAGTHRIEAWGNRREGFTPYLTAAPDFNAGVSVSSGHYSRLSDLRMACQIKYGAKRIPQGRNF